MLVRRLVTAPVRRPAVSHRMLRTTTSAAATVTAKPTRMRSGATRKPACEHGFHSCACLQAKAPAGGSGSGGSSSGSGSGSGARSSLPAAFNFGSKEAVVAKVETTTAPEEQMSTSATMPGAAAKRAAEVAQERALPFGSEPKLPDHLYNHLNSIDLFVKPTELDPQALRDLKARIIAINQKIRSELQMQPAQFYRAHYRARDASTTSTRSGGSSSRLSGSHIPGTDFHPMSSSAIGVSPDEAPVRSDFLRSQGLNNDPNEDVFDSLGHVLPRPLPKKVPCLFCRPPRDHPAEYYRLDYTNVNLLHRFLNERGAITAKRYNHNCAKHQRKVANAIKRARYIGLLSYTTLFHVSRDFVNAPDPRPPHSDEVLDTKSGSWPHRFTAASLPTGIIKDADFKFWTQEGGDDLASAARLRPARPLGGAPPVNPAPGAGASAGTTGTPAATAPKKVRDPNSLD